MITQAEREPLPNAVDRCIFALLYFQRSFMGAFFTNYQVRSESTSRVRDIVGSVAQARAYISPPSNGWVTVYDERSDDQDDAIIQELAGELSGTLKTTVLAFLVHDSDVAMYWLYRDGALVDEFNSNPHYFEDQGEEAGERLRGDTQALLPSCVPGTTAAQLEAILHPAEGRSLMAEDLLADLAPLLGIDPARISIGFRYFEDEQILPDCPDFEPVGKGAERKEAGVDRTSAEEKTAAARFDPFVGGTALLADYWGISRQLTQFGGIPAGEGKLTTMVTKLQQRLDRSAHDMLKRSAAVDLPNYEELKAARDQGPEALAGLVAKRAPGKLTEIGMHAAVSNLEDFVAALVAQGLDPKGSTVHGLTPLAAAERHGHKSKVYQILKAASDKPRA